MSSGEFRRHESDDLIVVRAQTAITMYLNPHDDIVIRQHAWPDDDVWIVVKPENAGRLAEALLDFAGGSPRESFATLFSPQPKDPTAAERQRRRRAMQRDSVPVTPRHGDLPFLLSQEQEEAKLALVR